jgi:predicted anti-sigma-YlaC factor YlaD
MECTRCQEILSAALDGEAGAADAAAARRHALACETCGAFAAGAEALHRRVRLAPAERVPDLTAAILHASAPVAPAGRRMQVLRAAMAAAAVVQLALSFPTLFPDSAADHARHVGAFDVALAVGFAWVALNPRRALSGFLPVGTVLVTVCFAIAVGDAVAGHGETLRVANHVIAFVGLLVAWVLEVDTHDDARDLPLAA